MPAEYDLRHSEMSDQLSKLQRHNEELKQSISELSEDKQSLESLIMTKQVEEKRINVNNLQLQKQLEADKQIIKS